MLGPLCASVLLMEILKINICVQKCDENFTFSMSFLLIDLYIISFILNFLRIDLNWLLRLFNDLIIQ